MSRAKILVEIDEERQYQDKKWGTELDDTVNTPWMWVAYIVAYAGKWMAGNFLPLPRPDINAFRTCMIKVAAICVAAVESLDRQREKSGKAFYEA